MKKLRRLFPFLRPYGLRFLLLLGLLLAGSLLALAAPLLSGRAVDAIGVTAGTVNFPGVFQNCAGMLCPILLIKLPYSLPPSPGGAINLPRPAEGCL